MSESYFTHSEHGGLPVEVKESGSGPSFVLNSGSKDSECYPSWEEFRRVLYGRAVPVSYERYFQLGRYSRERERPRLSTLDLFRRGIDLTARGHEVECLLRSQYGSKLPRWGLDYEEVLQEVMAGLLRRNQGAGAWDPTRGSFGTYVILVASSVISNLLKREQRRREREVVGLMEVEGGAYIQVPVESSRRLGVQDRTVEVYETMVDLCDWIRDREDGDSPVADLACRVVPLVYSGMKRAEIAKELRLSVSRVGRALRYLRDAASGWNHARLTH